MSVRTALGRAATLAGALLLYDDDHAHVWTWHPPATAGATGVWACSCGMYDTERPAP